MSLGLLGAYSSGSDDSDSENEDPSPPDALPAATALEPVPLTLDNPFGSSSSASMLLPKPSFMQEQQGKISGLKLDNSIFSNPFRDKEDKKKAILEQHVNMTQRQEELKMIDGKKVCWMARKGRCRQGSKCKFAHDSDVNMGARDAKYDAEAQIVNDKSDKGAAPPIQLLNNRPPFEDFDEHKEEEEAQIRKKRPGLSEGLVPSKKAMTFHKRVYN